MESIDGSLAVITELAGAAYVETNERFLGLTPLDWWSFGRSMLSGLLEVLFAWH